MAYKVRYGVSRHDKGSGGGGPVKWLPIFLVAVVLIAGMMIAWQDISYDWLLPGDHRVTAAALENLREDLAAGEAFGEAVTAFCREIIDGAATED